MIDKIKKELRNRTRQYASQGSQYAKDILAVLEDHDRLREALQGSVAITNQAGARIKELEEREQKLIAGLQFYADEGNWGDGLSYSSAMHNDFGTRASTLLKELGMTT